MSMRVEAYGALLLGCLQCLITTGLWAVIGFTTNGPVSAVAGGCYGAGGAWIGGGLLSLYAIRRFNIE